MPAFRQRRESSNIAYRHPIHLHRHTFELVKYAGQPISGIWKDVVVVPAWQQVEIDVPTTQPGLSLFHCHHQFHMDNHDGTKHRGVRNSCSRALGRAN